MRAKSPEGARSMDLGKTVGVWQQAVMNPVKFFSKLKKPELSTAVKWAVVAGVAGTLLSELALLINGKTDAAKLVVDVIVSGAIVFPLVMLIVSGLFLFIARLLGGKGEYNTQTYAMAAVQAPTSIVISAIAFLFDVAFPPSSYLYGAPVRAGLAGAAYAVVGFAIGIYALYALVVAFRSIHKYSTVRAIVTFLVPAVLLGVIAVLAFMFLTVAGVATLPA